MTNIAAFLYLVSGVLFILALRGLSHPATSRKVIAAMLADQPLALRGEV